MSAENAKTLLNKLKADQELMKQFLADPEPMLKANDCTKEELEMEARALAIEAKANELDEDELAAVSGGGDGKTKLGGCTQDFYEQQCAATVEDGSWCWTNDKCALFAEIYGDIPKFDH